MNTPVNVSLRLLQLLCGGAGALLINVIFLHFADRRPFYMPMAAILTVTYVVPAGLLAVVVMRCVVMDRSAAAAIGVGAIAIVETYLIGGWLSFYVTFLSGALF